MASSEGGGKVSHDGVGKRGGAASSFPTGGSHPTAYPLPGVGAVKMEPLLPVKKEPGVHGGDGGGNYGNNAIVGGGGPTNASRFPAVGYPTVGTAPYYHAAPPMPSFAMPPPMPSYPMPSPWHFYQAPPPPSFWTYPPPSHANVHPSVGSSGPSPPTHNVTTANSSTTATLSGRKRKIDIVNGIEVVDLCDDDSDVDVVPTMKQEASSGGDLAGNTSSEDCWEWEDLSPCFD